MTDLDPIPYGYKLPLILIGSPMGKALDGVAVDKLSTDVAIHQDIIFTQVLSVQVHTILIDDDKLDLECRIRIL